MKKRILSILLALCVTISVIPAGALAAMPKLQPDVLYGDADSDGQVNLLDANLIERYICGEQEAMDIINEANADVNADGAIDEEDMRLVKEYLADNIDLAPILHTISFDTDGADEMQPVTAGDGYTYKGEIPTPSKLGFIFVNWAKEDGSVYYQDEEIITGDMKLTAVYEQLDSLQSLNLTSFSLSDRQPDVSFEIYGDFADADEVCANISLLPKDGSDPVPIAVTDNGGGSYTVYAPDGFMRGAAYELTLGDGLHFAEKDEMFRTAYFVIAKEESDNIKYNADVIFIKDTDEMNYTINGETLPVLEAAFLSNDESDEPISGVFTMPNGSLAVGDIVCIYENIHPNDRDYTTGDYADDALAYVRITQLNTDDSYKFESLNEDDAEEVISVPDSIVYHVDELPTAPGTVDINGYDAYARVILGQDTAPEIKVNDFLVFYIGDFDEAKSDPAKIAYGQITEINGNTASYKVVQKADIEAFMGMFVSQEVDNEELLEEIDQQTVLNNIKQQVTDSGFMDAATEHIVLSALNTDEVQQKLRDNGLTEDEISRLGSSVLPLAGGGGQPGGRTTFQLDGPPSVNVKFILGNRFANGIGVAVEICLVLSIDTKISPTVTSSLKIDLSASFEEELSFGFDVNVDDRWEWYGPIPVLKDLNIAVSIDIQNYSAFSVCCKIYTVGQEEQAKWEALQAGPNSNAQDRERIRKINLLAAKAKRLQAQGENVQNILDEINGYKEQIPPVIVDGVEYSFDQLEEALNAEDVSSSFDEVFSAQDEVENKTGLEQLMNRYKEMLDQECDWVVLLNQSIFSKEFHIKVVAIKLDINFIIKGNVNIAIGADVEYEVGKRYTFWLHLMEKKSGSSEIDLLDERFCFQFYVMGTLGLKIGIKAELALGIISTRIASIGASVEFGPYLRLWGYFVYIYEKLRPANTQTWNEKEEMLGAMYIEFGLYVLVKFKAQVFNNTFKYEPTLYDQEFPLLTVGAKQNVYDFAFQPNEDDILYIKDDDADSTNGITMQLPELYRNMKTMDMCSGEKKQAVYPLDKYILTFGDSRFTMGSNGVINVDVPNDGTRYLKCNMRIVWKCDKLAFSKYDTDISVTVIWTNLSSGEMEEKFTASVMAGNNIDGYEMVWSARYGRLDTFDLPTNDEILELLNYSSFNTAEGENMKYETVAGYQNSQTTGLNIYTDTAYYFDITPKIYTAAVEGVQNQDGTTETRIYTTTYGNAFYWPDLAATGVYNPQTDEYTSFLKLTDAEGGDVGNETIVNLEFFEKYGSDTVFTANYLDDSLTATCIFIGLGEAAPLEYKFKRGTAPYFEGLNDYVQQEGGSEAMIREITPEIAPSESSITYVVHCVINTEAVPKYTLNFETNGGTYVKPQQYPANSVVCRPFPLKTGYSLENWYEDAAFTQVVDFNDYRMPAHDTVFYAKWKANQYNVSFKTSLGTAPASQQVTYGEPFGALPALSNNAQKFLGWFTAPDGGTEITETSVFMETQDIILYAHWGNKAAVDGAWIDAALQQTVYEPEGVPNFEVRLKSETPADIQADSFDVYYKLQGASAWIPASNTPNILLNAGTYDIKLVRITDNNYSAFEQTYTGVFKIDKKFINFSNTGLKIKPKVTFTPEDADNVNKFDMDFADRSRAEVEERLADNPQLTYKVIKGTGLETENPTFEDFAQQTTQNAADIGHFEIVDANGNPVDCRYTNDNDIYYYSQIIVAESTNYKTTETYKKVINNEFRSSQALAGLPQGEFTALSLPGTVAVDSADIVMAMTLSNESAILSGGRTFDIVLSINQDVPVWGIFASVSFDTDMIELLGWTAGDIFTEDQFTLHNDMTHSPYKFLATLNTLDTVSSQGTFITLHFKLKDNAEYRDTLIILSALEAVGETSPVPAAIGSQVSIFVVTFCDVNGVPFEKRFAPHGCPASTPEPPVHAGYNFIGWSEDLSSVQQDMTVIALYEFNHPDDPDIIFRTNTVYTKPDTDVTIDFTVEALRPYECHAFTGFLYYEPSELTLIGNELTKGEIWQQIEELGGFVAVDTSVPGKIGLTVIMSNAGFDMSGIIFSMNFHAENYHDWQGYSSPLFIEITECSNHPVGGAGTPIVYDIENGSVNIYDMTFGDVNWDGKIDTTDVILIMRYALGVQNLTGKYFAAADFNHDGIVNAADALLLMRYIMN